MCEAHDIMNAKLFARKDADFAECIGMYEAHDKKA